MKKKIYILLSNNTENEIYFIKYMTYIYESAADTKATYTVIVGSL